MTLSIILLTVSLQVAGFCILYLLLRRRMERKLNPEDMIRRVKEELGSIMVELNRTTDQNVSLFEAKIRELRDLVEIAEKRIALLRREERKESASGDVYATLGRRRPEVKREAEKNVQQEVIRLHREGFSSGVIAGHLGTTVGEVELIISVDKRKS